MTTESWRVLLVDDDEVSRRAIRQVLIAAAAPTIHLDEAASAAEAQARLPLPGDTYSCLIVHCRLPDKTGVELIASLRTRGIATPILAVTGRTDAASDEAVSAVVSGAGASDYMPRQDLEPDRLVRRLRQVIRAGRAEAQYVATLAAVRHAAQNRDELLSIVAHDLRSPLNAIRIAADELVHPNLAPAERKLMVAAVQRAVRRADRLIGDLLDVTRIEAGGLTLACTAMSAKEILEQGRSEHATLARDGGLELQLEVDSQVGLVQADRERILQVLGNLLGNAVRHARDSGTVLVAAQLKGDMVEISVTDSGPGIAAEQLPHLFDRFFHANRQHRAGAGLGLAIAKGIVTAHGGTISVTSVLGQGARFAFTIPRAY